MNHHHRHPPPSPPPQTTTNATATCTATTTTMTTTTTTAITIPTTSGECGNCGTHTLGFLFHVRLRGVQRRLCTPCVLRLHPSSFCPVCFAFYDSNPPHPSKRISCSKCASVTHSQCASSSSTSVSLIQPYHCPVCSDPTKAFAAFSSPASKTLAPATATTRVDRIDSKSAGVLLCAAKIASSSMGKAVLVARMEAEKKAKDAALSRKKAREALEHVQTVIAKNKDGSVQLSGSASFLNINKKQNMSPELINGVKSEKL